MMLAASTVSPVSSSRICGASVGDTPAFPATLVGDRQVERKGGDPGETGLSWPSWPYQERLREAALWLRSATRRIAVGTGRQDVRSFSPGGLRTSGFPTTLTGRVFPQAVSPKRCQRSLLCVVSCSPSPAAVASSGSITPTPALEDVARPDLGQSDTLWRRGAATIERSQSA